MRNPALFRPDFKRAKLGDSIICFQANGCMASDHKFLWAGTIENFFRRPIAGLVGPQPFARVRVHKKGNLDSRDFGQTFEIVAVNDPSLQRLSQTLLLYVR